jgi:hypothetical protein
MEIKTDLEPSWSTIRAIRERLGAALADAPKTVREATQMVASELLENAIKYGEVVPTAKKITFVFSADGPHLKVTVRNGSTVKESVDTLLRRVDELASVADPSSLYISRLQELMENPVVDSTALGLYRVALEGGFSLSCSYEDQVVTVVATRSIA